MSECCRIDFHTHVVVDLPDFADRFADPRWPVFTRDGDVGSLTRNGEVVRSVAPSAWQSRRRIEEMDAAGVDRHVISPIPPLICDWGEPEPARQWAEYLNTGVAEMVRANPDRFAGLGTVPLHHPDAAVAVLRTAWESGLIGVQIGTCAGTRELDHPDLREFFSAADELGMLIFVHPLILVGQDGWTPRITGTPANFGLGMTTDTAIAATRLAFGGVTRARPGLRVCLAHGGGTFAWALSRIAHLWDRTNDITAAELTHNVFVDSVVYQPANLRYLVDRMGPGRVLYGTDYPLPARDDVDGTALSGLAPDEVELVQGGNAAALLDTLGADGCPAG